MENSLNMQMREGEPLSEADKARLADELKNVVANLRWVSLEMKRNSALSNTWMNLEIDRRHIMRELHAGRRLAVQDQTAVNLEQPFELDSEFTSYLLQGA